MNITLGPRRDTIEPCAGSSGSPSSDASSTVTGKIVRTDEKPVAKDFTTFANLTNGALENAIDRDESGTMVSSTAIVWTGTSAIGTANEACDEWADLTKTGTVGEVSSTGPQWTNGGAVPCNETHRLYCVEIDP